VNVSARRADARLQPLVDHIARLAPGVHVTAYDGSASGPEDAATRIALNSPRALLRILRAPRGLGLSRAWVAGDITIDGDVLALAGHERSLRDPALLLRVLASAIETSVAEGWQALAAAGSTEIEYRGLLPRRHSVRSDLAASEYHYGLSSDFYRILLGPSMTYSGAMFAAPGDTLEAAQARKHQAVVDKLQLDADATVLDIGCGWGSLLLHAAEASGCRGIGLTASASQAATARARTAGLGRVAIHHHDYRTFLPAAGATAAASVGMYEHVGGRMSERFFRLVRASLPPGGRYLNQAICRRRGTSVRMRGNSFVQRYVFPNGQLMSLSGQLRHLERSGFRVLSIESFGLGYAETIRRWLENLERERARCVELEGEARMRAWQIYLIGALQRFEIGSIDVTQVLAEAT
jgi:cyclopropane-fatty-acyl-phospholipid synthase